MFCNRTQEYLAEKGVEFEDRDITKNEAFLKELEDMNIMSTPVIVIDGEAVVGFKKDRLDELLGL
ncbi:MAG: glutaredoxin family protein [Planctomycetota bacterium]|nr:glutaredoxin family protein [Planctomycetota bacterium]